METKQSMSKVTVRLPESLWKRTRIRALEEGRDAQDIIRDGLELYFAKHGKRPLATARGT
jgi:predicted DNA binding CopG/RHH family protein